MNQWRSQKFVMWEGLTGSQPEMGSWGVSNAIFFRIMRLGVFTGYLTLFSEREFGIYTQNIFAFHSFWCNLSDIQHRLFRNFRGLGCYPRKFVRIFMHFIGYLHFRKGGPGVSTQEIFYTLTCILVNFIGYLTLIFGKGSRDVTSRKFSEILHAF